MDREKFEAIYNLPPQEQEEALNKLNPMERADYRVFEVSKKSNRDNKKILTMSFVKKFVIPVCTWVAINLVIFLVLRGNVKADLRKQVDKIYKNNGCLHGIQVDGQWFAHADEMTDYLVDKYGKSKFYIIYMSYEIEDYQYYYHITGL